MPGLRSPIPGEPRWKSDVGYQIYPRNFADFVGDGIGDLGGVIAHLGHLEALGPGDVVRLLAWDARVSRTWQGGG